MQRANILLHQSSTACIQIRTGKGKDKEIPIQAYYRRIEFQEVEAPRFLDNRHRLPLLPQEIYSVLLQAESTPGT